MALPHAEDGVDLLHQVPWAVLDSVLATQLAVGRIVADPADTFDRSSAGAISSHVLCTPSSCVLVAGCM